MKITIIAGARPNLMKIAPSIKTVVKAKEEGKSISYRLVHTGQHFDKNMSDQFFIELEIPEPEINLESRGGTQAEITADIMVRFEKDLINNPTDLVLVVGDVTSTLACSIVAKKLHTKVAHVEAGIRSGDLSMPEEINRMVTDSITDYFFTSSAFANENLRKLGVPDTRILFVGNTMIDTLLANLCRLQKPSIWKELCLNAGEYIVITLHRPGNVDEKEKLTKLLNAIAEGANSLPVIFPVHPRTARVLSGIGINTSVIKMNDPLGYLEFNYLVKNAKAVITDSGGITEETTMMNIPCMTIRDNTERPETVTIGTNELIGTNPSNIAPAFRKLFAGEWKKGSTPPLWDGKTSERIVEHLINLFAA